MNKLVAAALLFAAAVAEAAPAAAPAHPDIPDALRPWEAWVLHGKEDDLCPFLNGAENETRCAWPSSLALELGDKGGRFTQKWRTWKKSWVPLPGDDKAWPQDVRVDGKPAVVATPKDDDAGDAKAPKVLLAVGEHTVTGTFIWDELPESVAVPRATGLLALTVRGAKLISPGRDDEGRLLLGKGATKVEADVLDMTAQRMITDSIPLIVTTRIQLRVSGRGREVVLGRSLPDGFVPMSLDSKIPARLEPDSRLRVQVRPGTWQITLVARHDGPVASLKRPAPDGEWAPEEVWVFDARPDLRLVTVEGVGAIDPQQTTLPDEWKRLPCYPMKPGDALTFVEHRRGDADPAPDRLSLHRELWLDYDGGGYTASDSISGNLNRAWRLEVDAPTELGRVSVGGKDQFITRSSKGGLAGVEVRQGVVDVSADSRIPGHTGDVPAVSWASDFHQVDGTLHLPPGWRLLHASGADEVPGTWIRHWTLLDLFLVLIIAMAVARLFGWRWGALALATLVLVFPEEESPRWMFLVLLAFEALIRALKSHEGKLLGFLKWLRVGSRVLLALFAVMFATEQVRAGVYPALEHSAHHGGFFPVLGGAAAPMDQTEMPQMINLPKGANGNFGAAGLAVDGEPAAPPPIASPVAKPDVARRALEGKEESKMSLLGALGSRGASSADYKQQQTWQYANEYDPSAMVQTGPGLPRWTWNDVALRFSGPVQRDQQIRLWLVGPRTNLVLALLRVVLLALLVIVLLGLPNERLPKFLQRRGAAALVLAILSSVVLLPRSARADVPPQPVLDELQKRLLEKPECWPSCASSPRLVLEIAPRRLRMRMEVAAAADTAVPLPGGAKQWVPEQVLLDGKPAPALLHADDGTLWLQVPAGSHQVILDGALPERDTVQIALPLKSHRVEAHADGWQLEGLHEDGHADDDLQLTRVRENRREGAAALQSGALPPFVRVEREVHVGLLWQIDTRVVRVTPTGSAVVLEVPLLPGESVTTPEVRVENGKALVNMSPSATEVAWHSLLQERPPIVLEAPRALPWTEVWRLDVSPIWHVELSGIPMVHRQNGAGLNRPEWQPWPGERVRIDVAKPEGISGRTLTIDRSDLTLKPGLRATDATLNLSLRSSRGGQHVVTLPEGAVLQQVTVDGRTQPLRQDKRAVTLPLLPGSQTVELQWRQPDPVGFRFATPSIDLGAPSVNATQTIQLGDDRWVLFVSGPRLGPAVLFWSFLIVIALVSLLLGRLTWTPLRAHHWLLLGLGLSQVPIEAAGIVAGWLLLLGWRRRSPSTTRWRFNFRQLFLAGWTLVALIVLIVSIRGGLLGEPEMQISGNGSFAGSLRWFQDRAESTLPRAQVMSVPLWAYRVAMLMWALWLAAAMLKWLRWGWGSFSLGGVWQKAPPKPPKPTPPTAPTAPTTPTTPATPTQTAPNTPPAPNTAAPNTPDTPNT